MFTFLRRIINLGWHNFWREGGLNATTVFVLTITICLITFIFAAQGIVYHLIGQIQDKIDISVYINPDSTQEEVVQVEDTLKAMPEVKNVYFLSKDEVLQAFKERHANDPVALESLKVVGANPFYASLNVRANSPDQYASIIDVLNRASFKNTVHKIDYIQKKTVISKLSSFISNVNKGGLILALSLAIMAILVAFNTIRVAIYDSSKEIAIMRLVGSPNRFIKGPFIVQAVICGAIASAISFLLFFLIVHFSASKIEAATNGFNLSAWWMSNLVVIIAIQFVSGIVLSVLSSLVAVRKYLRI